ncbi:FKBP-type peptidyl-prolyl cis-trans isomerase [Paracrocinitomix mangrovi]|uniref:FKBP-type peptidyl-prolyl cis-trans isomerase n=1 Tax=Paracrocinitomix mangrovi TaxID=2862509 RepID=UPI001C8F033B|nr:FKBP-type peptidyl-prolyl cis-trans isomerase [Paracrocinitomix mangrovi]UKN01481.1 FKBP-type peptidyl-prolyl cis-trans isomerase [Paracrocinitomix mangrovi]
MAKFGYLFLLLTIISCGSSENDTTESDDLDPIDKKIQDYLAKQDWNAEKQESGLYINIDNAGSAEKPDLGSFLTLKYEGRLLDGTVFDGTNGQAITFDFPLSSTIQGWQEGIPMIGKGGKCNLVIPPDLGYGSRDNGPIPGNSILVFDVELVDFSQSPPPPPDYSGVIDEYIEKNKLGKFEKTASGLYMKIEKAGGEKPTLDHFLTLNYEGYLLDGTVFDGTKGEPTTFSFPLAQTIEGWREGIPNIGKGGKGMLIIPPHIGYGPRDNGNIPANSVLVFEIEIIDFSVTPPAN